MKNLFILLTIFVSTAFVAADISPDKLSLNVSHSGPQKVPANSQMMYKVNVSNPHSYGAREVQVLAYLEGATFVSASNNGQYDSSRNAIVWNMNKMNQGQSAELTYAVMSKGSGVYTVCATATAKFVDCISAEIVKPLLSCNVNIPEKMSLLDGYVRGDFSVKNAGRYVAKDCTVEVTLNNLQLESGQQYVKFTGVSITAGDSYAKSLKIKPIADGDCSMLVRVTCPTANNTECSDAAVVATPELTISKSAPGLVYVGSTFLYSITVKNIGNAEVTNLVIRDHMPEGMSYVGSTYSGRFSRGKVTWRLNSLGAKRQVKVYIKVKAVQEKASPGWENVVYANCNELNRIKANAFTIVDIVPALNISIIDDIDPVRVGDTFVYTIAVNNEGKEEATNVRVKFTLPAEASYVEHSAILGRLSGGGEIKGSYQATTRQVIFETITMLKPGSGSKFQIKLKAEQEGSAVGTATATFKEFSKPFSAQEPTTFYQD